MEHSFLRAILHFVCSSRSNFYDLRYPPPPRLLQQPVKRVQPIDGTALHARNSYSRHNAQALDGSPAVRSTRPHAGYCSPTAASRRPSDCEHAAKGAWPLQQLGSANRSLAGCAVACHACRRCRYVSFSAENAECAWYQECDLTDLRQAPPGAGHDYQTVQVRREIADAPRRRQRRRGSGSAVLHQPTLRLAIATVVIGETEGGGIIGWCQGARNLRAALPERWAS